MDKPIVVIEVRGGVSEVSVNTGAKEITIDWDSIGEGDGDIALARSLLEDVKALKLTSQGDKDWQKTTIAELEDSIANLEEMGAEEDEDEDEEDEEA